jgi:cytochrome P450
LLDDADGFTKSPVHDHVLGEGGGRGLLIAEGELWRWERRSLAPLFRAEDVVGYVPDFVSACAPVIARWSEAPPGSPQAIDADMAAATLRVLEDTVLGAGLSPEDHTRVGIAATTFLQPTMWKIAYASLGLPPWTPHPGYLRMSRASKNPRDVASRALARRRETAGRGAIFLGD